MTDTSSISSSMIPLNIKVDECCNELSPFKQVIMESKDHSILGYQIDNHFEFRGIDYATSTRWKTSTLLPLSKLTIGLKPNENSNQCYQRYKQTSPYQRDFISLDTAKESEDCLNLNIYIPSKTAPKEGWPVAIYIHGGSFVTGGNASIINDPSQWVDSQQDLIVIVPNYRLGIFGWVSLPDPSFTDTNQGMIDILNSFLWTRNYIQILGGNPNNVTAMGLSSGAILLNHLLILLNNKIYENLIHRAILSSGSLTTLPIKTREDALNELKYFAAQIGCFPSDKSVEVGCPSDKVIECLQSKSAEELNNISQEDGFKTLFGPIVDGKMFKESPIESFNEGKFLKIPVLLTTVPQDGSFFVPFEILQKMIGMDKSKYWKGFVGTVFEREIVGSIFKDYGLNVSGEEFNEKSFELVTDALFHVPALKMAKILSYHGVSNKYSVIPEKWCFDQTKVLQYEKLHHLKNFHNSDYNSLFAPRHRIKRKNCNVPKKISSSSKHIQKAFGNFIKNGSYSFPRYSEYSSFVHADMWLNVDKALNLINVGLALGKHPKKFLEPVIKKLEKNLKVKKAGKGKKLNKKPIEKKGKMTELELHDSIFNNSPLIFDDKDSENNLKPMKMERKEISNFPLNFEKGNLYPHDNIKNILSSSISSVHSIPCKSEEFRPIMEKKEK